MNNSVMKFTPAVEYMNQAQKTAHTEIVRLHEGLTRIDDLLKSGRVQAARDEIVRIRSGKSEDYRLSSVSRFG